MNFLKFPALIVAFAMFAGMGCESVALVGRPSIDAQTAGMPEELKAEVVRLDPRSREIHLRTERGRSEIVRYDSDSRVMYGGREFPVEELRAGDTVVMQIKRDTRGSAHANLIRIQEGRLGERRSDSGSQLLSGTVERVNARAGIFDMRDRSGSLVLVSLPDNARRSELDQLARLREGDSVRVEGRFLTRDRFELEAFL